MASFDRNQEEFRALYQRHSREVWALAYARWMNADTALDITQEAFLRLWKQLANGETILNPRAWLLRVARNLAEDHAKSAFRRRWVTLCPRMMGDLPSRELMPDEVAEREEEREQVCLVLAELALEDQDLLEMLFVDGMTIRQISEVTGQPRSTVWSRIMRALVVLRQRLNVLRAADMQPGLTPAT